MFLVERDEIFDVASLRGKDLKRNIVGGPDLVNERTINQCLKGRDKSFYPNY